MDKKSNYSSTDFKSNTKGKGQIQLKLLNQLNLILNILGFCFKISTIKEYFFPSSTFFFILYVYFTSDYWKTYLKGLEPLLSYPPFILPLPLPPPLFPWDIGVQVSDQPSITTLSTFQTTTADTGRMASISRRTEFPYVVLLAVTTAVPPSIHSFKRPRKKKQESLQGKV